VRRAVAVTLSAAERNELEAWTARPGPSDRLRMRARIVLEAAGGRSNGEIARQLGVHTETVTRWRQRFVVNRVEGLRRAAPRPRVPARGTPGLVDRVLRMTAETSPSDGNRWTTRRLAQTLNVSHMFVHRVWKAHGLSPSSLATNPSRAVGRPWVDVVGLYVAPPAAALVFAVGVREVDSDEPIAHPRIDPDISGGFLPSNHHAPTALAGALSRAEELLPRLANARQSPNELLVFLRSLEESTPADTELHVVFDRPLEYISDRVGSWLNSHPRFHVQTAPAAGSWTGTADEWVRAFRGLPLHRDSFGSVTALTEAIGLAAGAGRTVLGRFSWTLSSRPEPELGADTPEPAPGTIPPRSEAPRAPGRPSGDEGDGTR
jgi:transposase